MIRLEMKKYNPVVTEEQQNYQHYHHAKLINRNILKVRGVARNYKSKLFGYIRYKFFEANFCFWKMSYPKCRCQQPIKHAHPFFW